MYPDEGDNGWGCDGAKQPGGCKRGINGFNQTTGIPRMRCITCDYDLCDKCMEVAQVQSSWHIHTLFFCNDIEPWTCKGNELEGGCQGHLTEPVVKSRYWCEACAFNVCEDCLKSGDAIFAINFHVDCGLLEDSKVTPGFNYNQGRF